MIHEIDVTQCRRRTGKMAAKADTVEETFRLASDVIKRATKLKLSNDDKLKLYAFFKQVRGYWSFNLVTFLPFLSSPERERSMYRTKTRLL